MTTTFRIKFLCKLRFFIGAFASNPFTKGALASTPPSLGGVASAPVRDDCKLPFEEALAHAP